MILSSSALTASALLTILDGCEKEITTTSPMGFEESYRVVDMDSFKGALRDLIAEEPANLFADLVGLTLEEAHAYIEARSYGDRDSAKANNAGTALPKVSTITVFFEDGRETRDLFDRTNALRGNSGMITGRGLGREYDLVVSINDGAISEIIHYGE